MIRLIVIELGRDDDREYADILNSFGTDNLRGCTIHLAQADAADAVLAQLAPKT